MLGRMVQEMVYTAQDVATVVPLVLNAAGMYQVVVQTDNAMWVERVIVQQ